MVMFLLWRFTNVNGYLYTFSGIVTCVIAGYGASFVRGEQDSDLTGLTIFTTDEAVSDA